MNSIHYTLPVSINYSPILRKRNSGGARKRQVKHLDLTFSQLKQHMSSDMGRNAESPQTCANLISALNAIMTTCKVSDSNSVSSILRASFYKNRSAHLEQLVNSGKSPAYIANRKSYLTRWHRLMLSLDSAHAAASNQCSPFSAALQDLLNSGLSQSQLAKETNTSLSTLKRWLNGAKPNERAKHSLIRIEKFFSLVPGELLVLAGLSNQSVDRTDNTGIAPNSYRERLRTNSADFYSLNDTSPQLRAEWRGIIQHKTSRMTYPKPRQKNGQWNTTVEKITLQTADNWYAFEGGVYVATAGIQWTSVAHFLGWLTISNERGGRNYPIDAVQTLAHLTDCNLLAPYIDWRIERAGQTVNGNVINFLKIIKSFCHPVTGYFTNTRSLGESQSIDNETWAERCKATFDFAKESISSLTKQVELSRNSFEPIKSILESANPLDAVADAIRRMNDARPSTGGVTEAVWARDKLLLKLLASNPIRAKNLKLLKIVDSATGNIISGNETGRVYRDNEGWRISIPKKYFKNFAGAAKERDYDMPINQSVWDDIENYLAHYRKLIASDDNPYFFTTSQKPDSIDMMYSLNRRVEALTRRYFWKCLGFGPHSFRHIVATAILKQSPDDWQTAALVLHDRVATVQKHYAHLRSTDGAERQFKILASSYARM